MRPKKVNYDCWKYKQFVAFENFYNPESKGKYSIYLIKPKDIVVDHNNYIGKSNTLKQVVEVCEKYLKENEKV